MIQQPSLSEQLAAWLVMQRDRGIPPKTLKIAQTYTLDWLGSALAGARTDPGRNLARYVSGQPDGHSGLVAGGRRVSAEVAALVNGGWSHIVEMDDLHRASVLHPGAAVIPAALAVAERDGKSGRDFLAAVVAGYEVAIRVGEAVGKRHYHYFHNTATCGVFGAAAAAGWLLGLSAEQFVWALGNAGTQAAGLWEFNADGAMSKHLHAGRAAANGVLAADLAAAGFTGTRRILEGDRGFFAATAPDADPPRVIAGLFDEPFTYKIGGVSIKPYPSCRHTHPAIDAALDLHEQLAQSGRALAEVAQISLDSYRAALDLCDNPNPQSTYAAKFSLHYCVAAALNKGFVTLSEFAANALRDEVTRALMARVGVNALPEFDVRYPAEWPTRVALTMKDGATLAATIDRPRGDPENPLTTEELKHKFRGLASYDGYAPRAEAFIAWVENLDSATRVALPSVS